MPLAWSALKSGLDPMRYTLRSVPKLLGKGLAWDDYCASERPLREAIDRLENMRRR
jgi:bifunctional non-homologous end joining protein LigD